MIINVHNPAEESAIINLTIHKPTAEQGAEGVGQPLIAAAELLAFDAPVDDVELRSRARRLTSLVDHVANGKPHRVMIGGYAALMPMLAHELMMAGHQPVFSFTARVAVEEPQEDGSVEVRRVFKHVGWQPAPFVG